MTSSANSPGVGADVASPAADAGPLRGLAISLRTPLYANAYALLANQVSSAALGFLYWLLAARLYPVEVVGSSSAVISMLLLIAGLAQLGLGSGMVRFMPRAGRQARGLVLYAYAAVLTAASVLSLGLFALSAISPLGDKLALENLSPLLLVVATVLWSVFYFQDGVLNGLGHSGWVLVENLLYNVAKIVLLVLGVSLLKDSAILGSWFLPTPFAIVLVAWLVFFRFIGREGLDEAAANLHPLSRHEIVTSVTWDHTGSMVSEASVRLLPLLVVATLGAAANAYFYQSWLIATTLTLAASGMSHSFTAQAASDPERVGTYSRGILRHMFLVLGPVALAVGAAAPLVLALFGAKYTQAAPLLRWLMLATPFVIFNIWYLAYSRVCGRLRRVAGLQAAGSVLLLVLGLLALQWNGITGVGVAWLVSQAAIAAVVAGEARDVLWGHAKPSSGLRRLIARADWRFLLPLEARNVTAIQGAAGTVTTVGAGEEGSAGGAETAGASDVVLSHDPGAATLTAAFRELRPGGACYSEWPAWRRGGVRAVVRRVSEAGFTDVRAYWTPPLSGADGGARQWLPSPASRRYRSTVTQWVRQRTRSTARGHMVSSLLDGVLRSGNAPTAAVVARKPGAPGARDPLLHEWLMDRIAEFDGPSKERTLVMTGSGRTSLNVHMLVFDGTQPSLRWIVKAPRRPGDVAGLLHERDMLLQLEAREDLPRRMAVPKMAFYTEEPGFPIMIESALEGLPLEWDAPFEPYPILFDRLTDLLTAFAGTSIPTPRREWWDRVVEPRLSQLEARLLRAGDASVAPAVREALSGLDSLPLVWAHNDCAPWNLTVTAEGFGLFDWEDSERRWLPAVDLTYCLATTVFGLEGAAGRGRCAATYGRLLDRRSRYAPEFHGSLDRYAACLGLRSEDLPALRVATWAFHAFHDPAIRLAADRGDATALRRSDCLPLLRAELERMGLAAPGDRRVGRKG